MRRTLVLMGATAILLAACSSDKLVGRPDLTIVSNQALPPPTTTDVSLEQRPYRIGAGDKLDIVTFGLDELSRIVTVDTAGNIGYPLAGTIRASGRTPAELASEIERLLRARYVRAPRVTVGVSTVSQVITIEGEVKEPGLYPVIGRMTLIRAVASAKGLTEYANTNYVVVYRTVEGRKMAALYDMRAIRQGIYDDPDIYPNDVVTVGESAGRRTFQTVIQGSGLLVTPIVALLN